MRKNTRLFVSSARDDSASNDLNYSLNFPCILTQSQGNAALNILFSIITGSVITGQLSAMHRV